MRASFGLWLLVLFRLAVAVELISAVLEMKFELALDFALMMTLISSSSFSASFWMRMRL